MTEKQPRSDIFIVWQLFEQLLAMGKQIYRFEPLDKNNKQAWLAAARQCSYAPVNALDETLLDQQLSDNLAYGNILIYNQDDTEPAALFPGEIIRKKVGPLRFNILRSSFGGLMVKDGCLAQTLLLKDFAARHVVKSYYLRSLRLDRIEVIIPPKFMIESFAAVENILPFYRCRAEANSILYIKMDGELIDQFKPVVRREVRSGLKNLARTQILDQTNGDILEYIQRLEKEKAAALNIEPLAEHHLRRVLSSPFYYAQVALLAGEPIACAICTYSNQVATYNFNASSQTGKKLFINKALLYQAIEQFKQMGARYFILGNSKEYSRQHQRLESLAFFKRSLSTSEAPSYRFLHSLTLRAQIAEKLLQRKKQRS